MSGRSKEIKEKLHHIRCVLGIVGDQETVNMAADLEDLIIQESERVEELEDARNDEYETYTNNLKILKKENQRYKQALLVIESGESVLFTPYNEKLWKVLNIAREALKGETEKHDTITRDNKYI
ncbi:hypothetical protein [Oceanobacillus profundus]|uniref:Uncharacterized protein n=1 Tax=Oceanobacillus profundus TaxID=372463 RepID=A0A417YK01_9BACI|nr:hypothetical protein [Oceanobacillus profundus]RHW33539.1 hypothetical protein D1B32_05715 [Oceanobacillus profundus]